MKTKHLLLKAAALLFISTFVLFAGCKPTERWAEKYAAKQPAHYTSLANHFVRTGGCKADTVTTVSVDSISRLVVQTDTLRDSFRVYLPADCYLDTALPGNGRLLIANGRIYLKIPVKDSIHYEAKTFYEEKTVRDLSEENLLRQDSAAFQQTISGDTARIKEQKDKITILQMKFWGLLILLAAGSILTLYLKLKP
jgi:hypothetical protein